MKELHRKRSESAASAPPDTTRLLGDLTQLIDSARLRVARTVNSELVLMYWKIGARIRQDILGEERAAYGEQIVSTLSRQLSAGYGSGFSRQNLLHMIRLVEAWPDEREAAGAAFNQLAKPAVTRTRKSAKQGPPSGQTTLYQDSTE